jgi:hypothetical protein
MFLPAPDAVVKRCELMHLHVDEWFLDQLSAATEAMHLMVES